MVTNPRHPPGRAAPPPGITSLISRSRALLSRAHSASLFSHISLASSLGRHGADDSRLLTTASGRREPKNNQGSMAPGNAHFLQGQPPSKLSGLQVRITSQKILLSLSTFKSPFLTLPLLTKSTGDDMYPGHLHTEVNERLGLERRRGTRVPELSPPSCGHSSSPCGPGR